MSAGWQLLRFLCVGVVNTCIGLGTIWALKAFGGWADVPANAIGYLVGLCVSFVLNRRWTFSDRGALWPAAWRFALVFAVSYSANLVVMIWLRDRMNMDAYYAHMMSTIPYTLLFFVGSRWFAFRAALPMPAGRSAWSNK